MNTTNLLTNLVDFEKKLIDIPVRNIIVSFNILKNQIIIKENTSEYVAQLNNNIIHQICSRIWQNINLNNAKSKWENLINTDIELLKELIQKAIEKNPITLRVYKSGNNNIIYGIVGQYYKPINQIDYRNELLTKMKNYNIIPTIKFIINKNSVSEIFSVNKRNINIKLDLIVNYPKNDGYHGFYTAWGREIIIRTNGLIEIKSSTNFHKKHNSDLNINQYLKEVFSEGQNIYKFTDENILKAQETTLNKDLLDNFLCRLNIASVSKERVINRLKIEIMENKNSEWALSQALTWLGTHEKHLYQRPKNILKEAGTKILDLTLNKYLEDENNVATENLYEGNTYKALLPKFVTMN